MARAKPSVESALKNIIPRGAKLLLAVSGGVDSMALFHGCRLLQRALKLDIEVVHVDHGLRNSSKRDALFVERTCKRYEIIYHGVNAPKFPKGENIEAWGRKIRYQAFAERLRARKLQFVLTAHNANDVAETLLMRLLSNKELTTIEERDKRRKLLRPFLGVTREILESFCMSHKFSHVEDETNQNLGFLRNRVRHKLIPVLEENFGPRIIETLCVRARALAADISSLHSLNTGNAEKISAQEFGSKAWLRALKLELQSLPDAQSWRLVESLFVSKLGFKLGRGHSQKLVEFFREGRAGAELPGGMRVRAKAGGIVVS